MTDFEKFLARESRRARIRRDIIPSIVASLALAAVFILGRCTA